MLTLTTELEISDIVNCSQANLQSTKGPLWQLRPYQQEGVSFLLSSDAALLADEMGLGKTVQTAVALRIGRRHLRRVLLVVPASLTLNWQKELVQWAPEVTVRRVTGTIQDRSYTYLLPVNVFICSYEQVRTDVQEIYRSQRFDLVVLDEAQRIKNSDSVTSLACRLIPRDRSWALSGTPIENSMSDLYSIFQFLKPDLIHDWMSLPEMHQAIESHVQRRTKSSVLADLPPIIIEDIYLELAGRQLDSYLTVWGSRKSRLSHSPSSTLPASMLAVLTDLKQICNYDVVSGESVKLDALTTILGNLNTRSSKVLIFSQFVTTLTWLSEQINLPNEVLHGSLSLPEREDMITRFRHQPGPRALLVSIKAGGVGLNLQEASTVVLFDRWWNPATENQAIQRAHRFGRTEPLHVIRFVVDNTIEVGIVNILGSKQDLFDNFTQALEQHNSSAMSGRDLQHILNVSFNSPKPE